MSGPLAEVDEEDALVAERLQRGGKFELRPMLLNVAGAREDQHETAVDAVSVRQHLVKVLRPHIGALRGSEEDPEFGAHLVIDRTRHVNVLARVRNCDVPAARFALLREQPVEEQLRTRLVGIAFISRHQAGVAASQQSLTMLPHLAAAEFRHAQAACRQRLQQRRAFLADLAVPDFEISNRVVPQPIDSIV
jgi:hypothetical protein